MGLLDAFTGAAAKKAARQNEDLLNKNQTAGMGYLDTGKTEGLGYLQTGMDTGQGYLDKAVGAYSPLAALGTKYGAGTTMLQNALGLGGEAGNQAAVGAFQAGPGYQFAFGQGAEALNRQMNAGNRPGLNSGNAQQEAIKYGQGVANQEYGNWMKNLGQFLTPEMQATAGAAQGQAGVYGQQATLANTGATNMANLTQNDATNRVNLGNMTTQGLTQNNTTAANAQMQAGANTLGAIKTIGSLALAVPTGGLSLAGLGGGLFSTGHNAG